MVSEAGKRATAKYEAKTYKRYVFRLRQNEDKDIIDSINKAQANGTPLREWLREHFKG